MASQRLSDMDRSFQQEVDELCSRLQINDPTFSCVTMPQERDEFFFTLLGYGARLGAALKHTTSIVTDMTLDLQHFLSDKEKRSIQHSRISWNRGRTHAVVESAEAFMAQLSAEIRALPGTADVLDWMQQSTSLQNITLSREPYGVNEGLLTAILIALAPNPSVRSLKSLTGTSSSYCHGWTTFFTTNTSLTTVRFELVSDEIDLCATAHRDEIEQAAHALAAHPALEDIHLVLHSGTIIYFFRALQSHAKLRHLTLESDSWNKAPCEGLGQALSTLLTTCAALQHLTLRGCRMYGDDFDVDDGHTVWARISSGLQSNPSITTLSIEGCTWEPECVPEFLDADVLGQALQHVRRFHFSGNYFWRSNYNRPTTAPPTLGRILGAVVASSRQLRHLDVSDESFHENGMRDFFDELTSNGRGALALESLTIRHARYPDILSDLAIFLPTTRHLAHLTIVLRAPEDGTLDQLPRTFWRGLLGNGSLHQVDIQRSNYRHEGCSDALSPAARRLIEAVTARNRLLPGLLRETATSRVSSSGAVANVVADSATTPSTAADGNRITSSLFPVLCTSSMPANLTAGQNLLIGLQAATAALAKRTTRPSAKRSAETME